MDMDIYGDRQIDRQTDMHVLEIDVPFLPFSEKNHRNGYFLWVWLYSY